MGSKNMGICEAVVEAAKDIGDALDGVSRQLMHLGNGTAVEDRGAIENLAYELREGFTRQSDATGYVSDSLDTVATAIEEGFSTLADAIHALAGAISEQGPRAPKSAP